MCQYWVTLRLKNKGSYETIARFGGQQMQERTLQRQGRIMGLFSDRNFIPGAIKHHTGAKRLGIGTLRGRAQLLNYILGTRGLYIFSALGIVSNGHAIAFDTTDPSLYFLDPNIGQFWFDNGGHDHDAFFRNWFPRFWEAAMFEGGKSYKTDYHLGEKDLWRYTRGEPNELMNTE
jgi:hypothetical protein